MTNELILGDEAAALGAVHAGISAGYSYPGTPASEVMEFLVKISKKNGFHAHWCVNEKVAYEEALGVSFAGKRSIVSMKHVGLNVAADPFMNSSITRINGGLVVLVADDPGMHSSQNEQDTRYYAQFAQTICLEPSSHQEAYDMTRKAFDLSESFHIPVVIRMVTRLAHSRGRVKGAPRREKNKAHRAASQDWTLLPLNARRRFAALVEKQPMLLKFSQGSPFNSLNLNSKNNKLGIVASGIGYNYVMESARDLSPAPSVLKICTYPLPRSLIKELMEHVDDILVVEEGYPFVEHSIKGLFGIKGKNISGKLSRALPMTGELNPDTVRKAMNLEPLEIRKSVKDWIPARPPQLCKGCPHIDTFDALNKALRDYPKAVVFSDIGCYTLGALPPYHAVDTCVCMGASVSMSKGGAEAGIYPSVGVIGDSTFIHSGITPLLDAVSSDRDMTVIILDNSTVAMTGGQPTMASGDKLENIVRGLGVDLRHIRRINPLKKHLDENIHVIREEIEHQGLSVIIALRPCIQETRRRKKEKKK
ncbi:MAG: indolepyruvate ferredoxin oxidoreductase [Candidatus Aminicenantes bacterium]|nr:indolepyruvate ferredoxin oxidoreductase [Candidatus Aminicenantes bacterium]